MDWSECQNPVAPEYFQLDIFGPNVKKFGHHCPTWKRGIRRLEGNIENFPDIYIYLQDFPCMSRAVRKSTDFELDEPMNMEPPKGHGGFFYFILRSLAIIY